jgi:ATP-dependent protease HslVU (ClpYQ) peptidase subunit
MTTIAWKDKVLAADSRITEGTRITSDNIVKIFHIDVKYFDDTLYYIAFAGEMGDWEKYLAALRNTDDNYRIYASGISSTAIVVGQKNVYIMESNKDYLLRFPQTETLSVGSGAAYALSAMKLGLSAVDAVKHARTLDAATGGIIRSVNLGENDVYI